MLKICAHKRMNDSVKRTMRNHSKAVKMGVRKGLNDSKHQITETIKVIMNDKKHGRWVFTNRSKSGQRLRRPRLHQHSRGGEPYAWMHGDTYRSLRFVNCTMKMKVGINTKWGAYWEKNGRSVLIPALKKEESRIGRDIEREIKRSVFKYGRAKK